MTTPGSDAAPAAANVRTIGRNLFFQLLTQGVTRAANLVILPLQTRFLGAHGFGFLSFADSFAGLWVLGADLGLTKSLVREVAQQPRRGGQLLSGGMVLSAAAGALLFLLAAPLLAMACPDRRTALAGVVLLATAFVSTSAALVQAAISGAERMEYLAWLAAANRLLTLAATVGILVVAGGGLLDYALGLAAAAVLQVGVSLLVARRVVGPLGPLPPWSELRTLLRRSAPFFLATALGTTYSHVDGVMLMAMLDETAVAYYQGAYRVVLLSLMVPASLMGSVYPTLARLVNEDRAQACALTRRLMRLLALASLPIAVWGSCQAHAIVTLLFGPSFAPAGPCLAGLIWFTLFLFTAFPVGTFLGSSGWQRDNVWISGVGAVVNALGNAALIPSFGPLGAVASTLATGVWILLASLFAIRRRAPEACPGRELVPVAFVLAACLATGLAARPLGPWWSLPLIAAAWLCTALACRALDTEDWVLARQALRRP